MSTKSKANKTPKLKSNSIFKSRLAVIFVVAFAAIGAYLILSTSAAKKPTVTPAVTLSLSGSTSRVSVGQTFTVDVKLNTNNEAVNAVQADFTYPANKLEFVGIDASGGAFGIEAPSTGSNGTVSIARGNIEPLNSPSLLVAKVTFKAIASGRKTTLSYASTSQVMRAVDSMDILQKTTGLQLNIQ